MKLIKVFYALLACAALFSAASTMPAAAVQPDEFSEPALLPNKKLQRALRDFLAAPPFPKSFTTTTGSACPKYFSYGWELIHYRMDSNWSQCQTATT